MDYLTKKNLKTLPSIRFRQTLSYANLHQEWKLFCYTVHSLWVLFLFFSYVLFTLFWKYFISWPLQIWKIFYSINIHKLSSNSTRSIPEISPFDRSYSMSVSLKVLCLLISGWVKECSKLPCGNSIFRFQTLTSKFLNSNFVHWYSHNFLFLLWINIK